MKSEFHRISRPHTPQQQVSVEDARHAKKKDVTVQKPTKNSIDANVWGPLLWELLFFLCFYCVDDKHTTDIHYIFNLLEYLMPCSHCRRSYSMFIRQLSFTNLDRENHGEKCAQWLWTIHDMVNQKLGKICISYEKLKRKHACLTTTITDFMIVDILCMMWLASRNDTIRLNKFAEFLKVISRMLQSEHVPNHLKVKDYIKKITVDQQIDLQLLSLKNDVLKANNMTEQSMESLLKQYESAIVG